MSLDGSIECVLVYWTVNGPAQCIYTYIYTSQHASRCDRNGLLRRLFTSHRDCQLVDDEQPAGQWSLVERGAGHAIIRDGREVEGLYASGPA